MSDVRVDPELRALIPPLSSEERQQLEINIRQAGRARDPLVVWQGILLDGHHRLSICEEWKLPYETTDLTADLADRLAAKIWVVENQFGRRNLNKFVRSELASKLEDLYAAQAKARQGTRTDLRANDLVQDLSQGPEAKKTRTRLAKLADVSHATFTKAKTLLKSAPPETVEKLRAGRTSIDKAHRQHKKAVSDKAREVALAVAATQQVAAWGDIRHCGIADLELSDPVDAIITDPPYDEDAVALYGSLARLGRDRLTADGVLVAFCGQTYLPEVLAEMTKYLPYRWMLSYLMPGNKTVAQHDRHVYVAWKPILVFGGSRFFHDVLKGDAPDKAWHHWGQEEQAVARLVEMFTNPGQTVVDPFLGGGTTAVVCKKLARKFIGGDVDPLAVEQTRQRLVLT